MFYCESIRAVQAGTPMAVTEESPLRENGLVEGASLCILLFENILAEGENTTRTIF